MRQLLVLQSGAAFLLQSGARFITKWGRYYKVGQNYYKVGQVLQSGAIITKWGITRFEKTNSLHGVSLCQQ